MKGGLKLQDDIFGNNDFLNSLSKKIAKQERIIEPFRLIEKQLNFSGIAKNNNLTSAVQIHPFETAASAYVRGTY